ncbi:DMT family transporter [Bdellovibrio sp. SKB1291214]|uniref:EamA family transporter n=1 Tax=Bdellovibrio sp. SKB1291214 TaxID=1732569 RepID=UPI000B515035|nr:DMT family transporter [Bdellovibrio sp. SKB1291214]UYL08615.1 DMT family transporter [Bdellovibrio sp. SKB1291214]
MEKLVAVLCVLIAIFSVQGGASFAKQLFPLIGPQAATFWRAWFSALILLAIYRPWTQKFSASTLKTVAIYGVCLACMNLTFYLSIERVPLGVAVALEFTGPLAVAILGSKRVLDILWVALAAAGIILILPHSDFSKNIDLLGALLALIAGAFWGFYIILAKKVGSKIPGGTATAMGLTVAALTVTVPAVSHVHPSVYDNQMWLMILGMAILSGAIPFSLEMIALRRIPSKTFGVFMSMEPAVAALMGLLFLNERLSDTQMVAIVCVMAASCGSSLTSRSVKVPGKQPIANAKLFGIW